MNETPPRAPDPLALLDALEQAHAAAEPGPWTRSGNHVEPGPGGDGPPLVARTNDPADAAAIVAAVNAVPQLTAALRAVLKLHAAVEWFEEVEPGDEVFDPSKPLGAFCRECTDAEYVEAVEDGYAIDQGSPVICWPCPTVTAITTALGGGRG